MKLNHISFFSRRIVSFGVGLITAQVLATWHVWQSNQHLLRESQAIAKAGWLSIPCGPAAAGLATFKAAFWGGLFFTLSLGAGLCLMTWGILAIVGRNGLRNWFIRVVLALVWAALLLTVNANGILVWESLFILSVPLVFGWVYLQFRPESEADGPRYLRCMAPVSLILLAVIWFTQYNSDLFTTIRDQLLLSNPAGRGVNTFYYRYTLYPAEAFKSFDQKTVRSCSLSGVRDPQLARRLAGRLISLNVLPLNGLQAVDLSIREDRGQLLLRARHSAALAVPIREFETDTGSWLVRFSAESDRHEGIRSLIFFSLVLAFPVLLYTILYGFLRTIAGVFSKPVPAAWISAGLCLALGILALAPVQSFYRQYRDPVNPADLLKSNQRAARLAGLRYIEEQKLVITSFPQFEALRRSPDIAERYWTARSLAHDRTPVAREHLSALLNDPEPIVRCQALYALGQQGATRAIEPILMHITSADHWYVQWYAYGALRKLGWRQKPLP